MSLLLFSNFQSFFKNTQKNDSILEQSMILWTIHANLIEAICYFNFRLFFNHCTLFPDWPIVRGGSTKIHMKTLL